MKIITAALAFAMVATSAKAELIAAKTLPVDGKTSAVVMLTDQRFPLRCNGHKGVAMVGSVIVRVMGIMSPIRSFNACYYRTKQGDITFQFWDSGSGAITTLDMDESSFERTPNFKSWDILPITVSPSQ